MLATQIRAMERSALAVPGADSDMLMQAAGTGAYTRIRARWPSALNIVIVCGNGNNAGDGYVFAERALRANLAVRVLSLRPEAQLPECASRARDAAQSAGVAVEAFDPSALEGADVVVDALLGIGVSRDLNGSYASAVKAMNAQTAPVLALDVPSGLCADTGRVFGCAVHARETLTFLAMKPGLLTGRGPEHSGHVVFDDLGVAPAHPRPAAFAWRRELMHYKGALGRRRRTAHKGTFGHVLVIGGAAGFGGAVRLAAEAAARTGAGLISVATEPAHAAYLTLSRPEIMCRGVAHGSELSPLLARATVLIVGPGLGQSQWSLDLLRSVLRTNHPLVLDADALNLLVHEEGSDLMAGREVVLTPHPGEAARLLNCKVADVEDNRFKAAAAIAQRYSATCVLKGAGTIVIDHGHDAPVVCSAGNPGMASGGMGDVLSGVIGALIAQGMSASAASAVGVCLHASAADVAATRGERGLLASDLFEPLRELVDLL